MAGGWILAIKIESHGLPSSSPAGGDQRWRWCTRRPAWDTENLYQAALARYPQEISWSLDLQRGTGQIGGQSFELQRTAFSERRFLRSRVDRLGVLAASISSSATSLQITALGNPSAGAVTSLAGTTILLGREAVYLSAHTGGGVYDCTRAVLGTRALPHTGGQAGGTQAFNADHGRALVDRVVDLIRVPYGDGSYDTEEVLWSGVITGVDWAGDPGRINLTADTFLRLLGRGRLLAELPRFRRVTLGYNLDGDPEYAYEAVRANTPCLSATPAEGGSILLSLGGKAAVRVPVSFTGTSAAYRASTAPIRPGRYQLFAGSENVPDELPEEAWEFVSTSPAAPSNFGGGSAELPLSSNALTLLLQILTTSADGANYDAAGGATSYDLGQRQLGLGIPWSRVDVAGIEAMRARFGGVLQQAANHPGFDGEPVEAEAFIQQRLLRPYGLILTQLRAGLLGVVRIGDALPLGALELTQAVALGLPRWRRYGTTVYDEVEVRYNDRPGTGPRTDLIRNAYAADERLAGSTGRDVLRLDGLAVDDEDTTVPAEVLAAGLEHLTRYSEEIPAIDLATRRSFEAWPGDVIALTHNKIPSTDGSRGITRAVCQVQRATVNLGSNEETHAFSLLHTGALYRRAGAWSVAARVVSWSSPWATIEVNAFISADNPGYASDAAAWEALLDAAGLSGATLELRDSALALRNTATLAEVDVAGNRLRLSIAPTAPNAGDVLILGNYTLSEGSPDEALWAFVAYLASDDGVLGTDEDAAYEWTS